MRCILQKVKTVFLLSLCIMAFLSGCGDSVSVLKNHETEEEESVSEMHDEPEKEDVQKSEEAEEYPAESQGEPQIIYVDICGAVKKPGVYELPRGSRVFQAIEKAGGFLEEAQQNLINQAEYITDGQQIRIYTKEEAEKMRESGTRDVTDQNFLSQDASKEQNADEKININQADKAMLMTLSGIGETRAQAIIAYRQKHGSFSTIEELMQVEGIKEKIYEKLKDKITVQ